MAKKSFFLKINLNHSLQLFFHSDLYSNSTIVFVNLSFQINSINSKNSLIFWIDHFQNPQMKEHFDSDSKVSHLIHF